MNNNCNIHIKNPGNVLFVGLGNRFRKDDYVGLYIGETLKKCSNLQVLNVDNSLENYLGIIRDIAPEEVILIDAIHFNREPGYYNIIPLTCIKNDTVNTHSISLRQCAKFMRINRIRILGIQPEDVSFGTILSQQVLNTAHIIIYQLLKLNAKTKTLQP